MGREELRYRQCTPHSDTHGFDFIIRAVGFIKVFKQGSLRIRHILERLFWLHCERFSSDGKGMNPETEIS